MPNEPRVIYSAASAQQAYLLKSLLAERGIAAWVVNDAIQIAGGELPLGWTAAAKVVVRSDDALDAHLIANEFDHTTAHEPLPDGEPLTAETDEWADWPLCPACRERRSARCSVCGISANRFPMADLEVDGEGGQRVFLMCAACDDHFLPEWHRICPRCGHDFGDGIEVETPRVAVEFNLRSGLVLAAMAMGIAAFAGYFLWLFSQRSG